MNNARRLTIGLSLAMFALSGCGATNTSSTATTTVNPTQNDMLVCSSVNNYVDTVAANKKPTSDDVLRIINFGKSADNSDLVHQATLLESAYNGQSTNDFDNQTGNIAGTCHSMGIGPDVPSQVPPA